MWWRCVHGLNGGYSLLLMKLHTESFQDMKYQDTDFFCGEGTITYSLLKAEIGFNESPTDGMKMALVPQTMSF